MLFAGAPADDIDWADVSPAGSVKWLARVWRLAGDVGPAETDNPAADGTLQLRREVHRLIDQTGNLMRANRLNVAIARLMELTSALRKAIDTGPGRHDPAVREGVEALVRMMSCFAPFTAEEAWHRLGHAPSVADGAWPVTDPELLTQASVTCVVQVAGKVRDRLEVAPDIDAAGLRALALASPQVVHALDGAPVSTVIVRPPGLVNVVPGRT